MDSFTAKGLVFSKLSQSPIFGNQNNSIPQFQNLSNTSLASRPLSNTTNNFFVLEGGWELVVRKGEVNLFQSVITLSKDEKIVNVFALANLTTDRYIQLNDKGVEIISGTVDFISAGLKNATLSNVDATITLRGFTQLRITLDNNIVGQYINKPLIGQTKVFADGNGNLLLAPTPESSPNNPSSKSKSPEKNNPLL